MRIVLAFDGSPFSEAALRAISSQLRSEGAEVLVLRVVEPRTFSAPPQMAPTYIPEQDEILKEELKEAEQSVAKAAQTLRAAGFAVHTRTVTAETRSAILDVASEWRADWIVLGSHGRRGLRRFVLGSVAESVARAAHCSVLIVRSA